MSGGSTLPSHPPVPPARKQGSPPETPGDWAARFCRHRWEQAREFDEARKLYRRALDVPMTDHDTIWRDYEKFEKDLNKHTAETALMKARDRWGAALYRA